MRLLPWLMLLLNVGLSACNMVISEKPMFDESDRGALSPREGIWLSEDKDCPFDPAQAESAWPECALWVVVRNSGRDLVLTDGKGQSQQVGSLLTGGMPAIIEGRWVDDAKSQDVTYGYFAVSPDPSNDGRFTSASVWPVDCGIQNPENSQIEPFPGITPECRPTSKEAIRAAAVASRQAEEVKEWRWLRPEKP